jgi:hypothetical protein
MVGARADLILQPQLRCHLHLARETIMPAIDMGFGFWHASELRLFRY